MSEQRLSLISGRSEYYSCDSASGSDDDTVMRPKDDTVLRSKDDADGCEGSEVGMEFSAPDSMEMGPLRQAGADRGVDPRGTGPSPNVGSPPQHFHRMVSWVNSEIGASDMDLNHLTPEQNYRTITSMQSFEETQPTIAEGLEGESTLDHGLIKFEEEAHNSARCCKFITATTETPMDSIANYMSMKWKVRTPKVVLSIISGVQHSRVFYNSKIVDDFQKGLIKVANSTIMWVLTDGVDLGVPRLVGDAVAEELARRKLLESDRTVRLANKLPKLTVIGVILKDMVNRSGRRGSTDSFCKGGELNGNHTHFLLLEGSSERREWVAFRNKLEERFLNPVGRPRKYRTVTTGSDSAGSGESGDNATPMLAILVQGGLEEIDHVLSLLKRRKPVLVIKGSGYAADLIAFAYEGLHERQNAEHLVTSVKSELMRKVGNTFPSDLHDNDALRTTYRDKILQCIELANQESQTFVTVVDVTQWDTDLQNLSKYILQALFKSEKRGKGKQLVENILRDLQLTLDWNLCDLAESAILERYSWKRLKIENYLFEQSVLQRDREEFVDLFMRHGFQVHKYLNHRRLQYLFENAEDVDLFYGVCLQKALGKIFDPETGLDKSFLEGDFCLLNRLLFKCTNLNNLVNPYELSMNCLESYVTNVDVAERKAVNTLLLWSALTHKVKLTKLLWKKVDDPIPMALLLSNLFYRLSKFCDDRDLRSQLKQHGAEFGKMALEIFDLSYMDSPAQALSILSKQLPDYDNRTTLEIAYIGQNRAFISHKCCQRWLTQRWHGMLVIRELDWGLFTVPSWLKIYLSAFLIFPMYVWMSFITPAKIKPNETLEVEMEEEVTQQDEKEYLLQHLTSIEEKHRADGQRRRMYGLSTLKNAVGKVDFLSLHVPLHKQINYLWGAPITKFWMTQLFYMAFLSLFTVALILPTCGNLYLDLIVFTWTLAILVEIVRFTIVKKKKYPEMSVMYPSLEIMLIATFLGFYLFVRIIPHFVVLTGINYEFTDYQSAKFVMSLGLLYFYYRLLSVCFPISPTLGPMLINILRMVKDDFSTWLRMFLLFMISGAITIQAVIYPNYPLSWVMFRKALSRALFAVFLTKIDDLEEDSSCSADYPNSTLGFCGKNLQQPLVSPCPYGGNVTYLIVIQYLLIVKLVLTTLLFAMFSSTIAKISAESNQIWKFQRYNMIVEFEEKLRLPPPLTIVSYFFMLVKWLWWQCMSLRRLCLRCCRRSGNMDRVDSIKGHAKFQGAFHYRRTEDFNYWKKCIKEFTNREAEEALERDRPKADTRLLHSLIEDMSLQKRSNRKLNDRLVTLEKGLTSCLQLMEEAKHMIEKLDPKLQGMISSKKQQIHLYSRQSPYPDTTHDRFPVLDKFVPWEIVYTTYDPCVYTKPVDQFPIPMQKYVDVDVLRPTPPASVEGTPVQDTAEAKTVKLRARWNAVCTVHVDNMMIEVDRTSWISEDGRTCRYKLDKTSLPMNPQGRTGVRGRGSLWRWGPNHSILGVVTRCKTKKEEGKATEPVLQEGRKVLEFITIQEADSDKFELPGGIIHGETSPYSLICELFLRYVLQEEDVDSRIKLDKDDMVDFFSQFAVEGQPEGGEADGEFADSGFTAEILYRGYLDDPQNTDNAWLETEVWNFHYEYGEDFAGRCQHGKCQWQDLSSQTPLHGNQLDIILEVAKIHNAYH